MFIQRYISKRYEEILCGEKHSKNGISWCETNLNNNIIMYQYTKLGIFLNDGNTFQRSTAMMRDLFLVQTGIMEVTFP